MIAYPVRYTVEKPARFTRVQLAARVVALLALALIGVSVAALFIFVWLLLPVVAAVRLASRSPSDYLVGDGPRVIRALQWFAAIYAWLGLATERLPSHSPGETVHLEVEVGGRPTPGNALLRILLALPSALVLALLGALGVVVWLWAAICVLVKERIGDGTHAYLTGLQRWSMRLLAYQGSLVAEYPPFSFGDTSTMIGPATPMPTLR